MDLATTAAPPRTLDMLPGPRPLPWLGNALQLQPHRFHQQLEDWAREHGGWYTFRLRDPRFLVGSAPDLLRAPLRKRADGFRPPPSEGQGSPGFRLPRP